MASDYHRIENAIGYLVQNSTNQPNLQALSEHLGLSTFHCNRLFKKWAGVTPKSFLQALTLAKAKRLLSQPDTSLLHTSLKVGLSGTSRLHDLFITEEAMTPGEYKKKGNGLEIHWDQFQSPLGKTLVAKTKRGICLLSFTDTPKEIQLRWPNAKITRNPKALKQDRDEIIHRLRGLGTKRKLSIQAQGTLFQQKVWKALLEIPEGRITTYSEIAKRIGAPKAHRAVGTAVASNPVGYLIPCHRVIRASGAVGDYRWGHQRKVVLISNEVGRSLR